LKRITETSNPKGNRQSIPVKPNVNPRAPATNGPRKYPVLPLERKNPIALPFEDSFERTIEENAGGWKAADPKPALPTIKRSKM
jgi:hypothetical protein